MLSGPGRTLAAVAAICLAALGAYLARTAARSAPELSDPRKAPVSRRAPVQATPTVPTAAVPGAAPRGSVTAPERIFFRHNGVDEHYGRLAFVEPVSLARRHFRSNLSCEAFHASAARGICLFADRGVVTTYAARIVDSQQGELFSAPLNGAPSRCRVSPDGRIAAVTVFRSGHSYTSLDFTTQTLLFDLLRGEVLADIEEFEVIKDGKAFKRSDFNFWGVTFAPDPNRFYATLSTGGSHFLVRGRVDQRRAEVIFANVECPSVSPSGALVAYKKRLPPRGWVEWQLHVLDLGRMESRPLPERRSVDDQLEWLDETTVLYSLPAPRPRPSASTDVWQVPIDGSRQPTVFLENAYSPAVLRGLR